MEKGAFSNDRKVVPGRRAFRDLAYWMIGLGVLVGIVFPFAVVAFGVPKSHAFTSWFFFGTVSAGIIVGAVNFGLAHWVVRSRLRMISQRMRYVETALREAMFSGDMSTCDPKTCMVPSESEDDIGQCASAFNALVNTLFRAQELENAVGQFTEALTRQLELTALGRTALDHLIRYLGASAGAILIDKDGTLEVLGCHGLKEPGKLAECDYVHRSLRTLECQIIDVPGNVTIGSVLVDFRPRQIIVIPIESNETAFGVVILATGGTFAADLLRRVVLFRRGLGLAMQNARQHERLQEIAAVDPLTSLYNRRFGITRLREEFARARRHGGSLGVIMFDIDHFKNVNDTYGHIAGDRVLTRVAKTASYLFRESDVVVRLGGEEFCAVVPDAGLDDCLAMGERLRQVIEESHMHDGDSEISVTVSVGVAALPDRMAAGHEDLLRLADQALYAAKNAGRNRVCSAGEVAAIQDIRQSVA